MCSYFWRCLQVNAAHRDGLKNLYTSLGITDEKHKASISYIRWKGAKLVNTFMLVILAWFSTLTIRSFVPSFFRSLTENEAVRLTVGFQELRLSVAPWKIDLGIAPKKGWFFLNDKKNDKIKDCFAWTWGTPNIFQYARRETYCSGSGITRFFSANITACYGVYRTCMCVAHESRFQYLAASMNLSCIPYRGDPPVLVSLDALVLFYRFFADRSPLFVWYAFTKRFSGHRFCLILPAQLP